MRPLTFLLVALGVLLAAAPTVRGARGPGLGLIGGYAFSAPYEDLKLKGK